MTSLGAPELSARTEIDEAVREVSARADAWAAAGADERARLLGEVLQELPRLAEEWISASLAAKGLPRGGMAEAEEWLFFATVLRSVRRLRASLREVAAHGHPRVPGPVRRLPGRQIAVRAFPASRLDRFVYRGMTGEVWPEPGRTVEDLRAAPRSGGRGEVAAVLGAGNASMLPAVDALHQLVVEGRGVVLKPSPVNAYLGPLLERAFRSFVEAGVLRLVYGGAEEGARLCAHPAVAAVHLTGSGATFRAIAELLASGPPKHVTAELGNVSPVIVVPGPWSRRDVERQAERIATWLVANAGFGCLTPRVLVQHRDWPLREAVLDAVEGVLARVPARPSYYPGAESRFARFMEAHPEARLHGRPGERELPWAMIPDLDPDVRDDLCFREEAFCGLVAETALPAAGPEDFLREAVRFANDVLWGTLVATLVVHPASLVDPALATAVDGAVAELRYGTVTVNAAAFAAYHTQVLPWGAFPPADSGQVESGLGKTGNGLLLRDVQKSVLRGPFTGRPDPFRVTVHHPEVAARSLAGYAASGSARALPGLAAAAVAGELRGGT